MHTRLRAGLMATLLLSSLCAGAEDGPEVAAVHLFPGEAAARIDGVLDEPAWGRAPAARDFRQREPHEGEAASEDTEVRVLYDRENLYVGVRAWDREPAQVIARSLERDTLMAATNGGAFTFAGDDAVALLFDPFADHRNAFLFATNPRGAEFDALITDENPAFNADWRGTWRVAAAVDAQGWTAEFAIPFRTLRYPRGAAAPPWGLNVERMIRRKNEDTLWSGWSRSEGGLHRVSRAGRLTGLRDLPRRALNVELKPFALGGATIQRPGGVGPAPAEGRWRAGGDAKWEVRPGVVLDATVRPDFAQVEADPQVVNLTRFELFFPEKRDFFLENAGLFDFGTRGSFETPPFLLFFSRRIGTSGAGEVPVLAGLRLSGRSGRQTVGLLDVVTGQGGAEPRTNFGLLRVKRDAGQRGYVGAMVTDRRASGRAQTDVGLDASLWPAPALKVQAFAARTSDAQGRADFAGRAWAEYQGDPFYANAELLQVGPRAGTGMGFVTRTDLRRAAGKVQYTLRPHALGLQQVALFAGGKYQTRVDGAAQDGNGFGGFSAVWKSGENMSLTRVWGFTVVDFPFPLSGRIPIPARRFALGDTELFAGSSGNRRLSGFAQLSRLQIWDGLLSTLTVGAQWRAGSGWPWARPSRAARPACPEAPSPRTAPACALPGPAPRGCRPRPTCSTTASRGA